MQDLKDNLKDKRNSLRVSKTAKEYLLKDGSHRGGALDHLDALFKMKLKIRFPIYSLRVNLKKMP